jgi:outer membrane receptor protein involved in Fe transport
VSNAFLRERETDSAAPARLATIAPSMGMSLRGAHEVMVSESLRHTLVTGIDLQDEKASTGFRTGGYSESNKASYGLYAEETLRILDAASIVAGARYDRARFDESISFPAYDGTLRFEGWSPKLGASIDVLKPLTVYANVSRPYKAPNVDDFSVFVPSAGGFTFVGNIDLKPQQGTEFETGLRFAHEPFGQAQAAFFYTQIDDEILFDAISFQNQNFDTERAGIEVSVAPVLPVPGLRAEAAYTFMEAEFHKGPYKGNTLPGVPQHEFAGSLVYAIIPGLSCSLDWHVRQDAYRINDFRETLKAQNYGTLDLTWRYTYKNVSAFFKVENLTNEEYTTFQSSTGTVVATGENPAPPRGYLGGVTFSF